MLEIISEASRLLPEERKEKKKDTITRTLLPDFLGNWWREGETDESSERRKKKSCRF